jgi:uncharacterized protein (TIGR02391 family)
VTNCCANAPIFGEHIAQRAFGIEEVRATQARGVDVDQLKMSFDPLTIEHLGVKMYSHLPNAVAELVANAYDADASQVLVEVRLEGDVQTLVVADNGHGMSRTDLQDKYLRIGRNRRDEPSGTMSESGHRRVSGKKGLGKLALFGIGESVRLSTTRTGSSLEIRLDLRWADILGATGGDYFPDSSESPVGPAKQGTTIELRQLKRSTPIQPDDLARSLARLFSNFDDAFRVVVRSPEGDIAITQDMRLESVDIEHIWAIPDDVSTESRHQYLVDHEIRGVVIAGEKPLQQSMRGVSLFANGRLSNEPEFFGASESSFAYSYMSGYLNVDYLDQIVPDVISTDRRAINWDTVETGELREQLKQLMFTLESQRRDYRRAAKVVEIQKAAPIDIQTWVDTVQVEPERRALTELLHSLSSPDIEMPVDDQSAIIGLVSEIAPPFADLHWRHLHPATQDAAGLAYKEGRYYDAVDEAIKRYVTAVRTRAGLSQSEALDVVNHAFSEGKAKLSVFSKYMQLPEFDFSEDTASNVEAGQRAMSQGIVRGFRNPLAHEEKVKLHESGAFNHLDCLDALSILSHLQRRLDDAVDFPTGP